MVWKQNQEKSFRWISQYSFFFFRSVLTVSEFSSCFESIHICERWNGFWDDLLNKISSSYNIGHAAKSDLLTSVYVGVYVSF